MNDQCTVYKTIDVIGRKWSLMIILSLQKSKNNKRQYCEIKSDLHSITPKILSSRLKELEKEGIIKKHIDSSKIPVNTFYSLTDSGKKLTRIIASIKQWGLEYKFKNKECESTLCRNCTI